MQGVSCLFVTAAPLRRLLSWHVLDISRRSEHVYLWVCSVHVAVSLVKPAPNEAYALLGAQYYWVTAEITS